jgi:four helix bundle protein
MPAPRFDHEKLRAYQEALRFVAWSGPVIEALPLKLAVRDQLDRASTSVVLNLAEGNGKRQPRDRCRYLDSARGSAVECAACLDVLVVRKQLSPSTADEGKSILLGVVSLVSGLLAYFAPEPFEGRVEEEAGTAVYGEDGRVGNDVGSGAGIETGIIGRENE